MLSKEENELVTRVGPGTPMGNTLRRYWIPALLSWELPEPDCDPVRVRLPCEDLVGFRDTDGRIGIIDESCPHRLASMWLGRNEECGLRCVYHGWKFDVDGNCVDQMNELVGFEEKIKIKAYPTVEMGGIIWVYMGPKDKQPAPPAHERSLVPDERRYATKVLQECNWLQGLKDGIDTSHVPILHKAISTTSSQPGIDPNSAFVHGEAPTLKAGITDYGYRYFGIRKLSADERYVRGYRFLMPWTQLRPGTEDETDDHFWVPIDDENCVVWNWFYTYEKPLEEGKRDPWQAGNSFTSDIDINNRFRSYKNRGNNWMIDQEKQRTETFTGISGINIQDRATQETMGPIVDRTREHLGPADAAIIATRKLLAEAVRIVEDGGDPPGVAPTYYEIRAAEAALPIKDDWFKALMARMYPKTGGVKV